ncbi:PREDICTED: uncharacterized protein LOC108567036 [Nicrophorus vespilloides]|uniref:Uncharacterized protein LOC108567036 n=1 Tax=Nicrophorus vespilloides TaxID=110193 RepID=A0ABM1N7B3_NICVS|nr:PREDICTED: uncharacterized protein LOC108567036 [Nicrophorus vespilloides]
MMIRYKMVLILLVIVCGANIAHGQHPPGEIHHHQQPEFHHDYSIPPQHLDQNHLDPHNLDPHHLDQQYLEQENHGEEGDPIVGIGLGIPIVDALALGAKAKAAVLTSVAGAHALSLKARADIHKHIQEAKIHHDLLSARARANIHNALYYGHHPILGAANHEAGPEDTKEAIMQEVDEAMSDYPREVTENVGLMHDLLSHRIVKRSNLKRDEDLFVWSLNNGNNFRSSDSDVPRESYNVKLLGNTDFWKNHQITKQTPIDSYFPKDLKHTESDSLVSVYPGDWKPDSHDGINDYKVTPSSFDIPDKLREANPDSRHFNHHFFHKRPFGFHPGNQQPQVDHWGKPISHNPVINPIINPVHPGIDFNSFKPNAGLDLSHVKPTQVTINNQQNTFSNAVSGGSNGNQKIQVSQVNGPGTSQQVSSASSEFVSSPYLLHFPEYRRSHHKKRSLKSDLKANILTDEDIRFIDRLHKEFWNELKVDDWKAIKKTSRPSNEIFKLRPLMIESISRKKRSLPLLRLMADPNAKLDMPKTLENVGTIARNSFEDKRAPMYHVKNFVGSTKNAVLSALKMAPQELIIPSQYKIVDTSKDVVMKPAEVAAIKARAQAQPPAIAPIDLRPKTLKERFEMWRMQKNAPKMESKILPKVEPILGQAAPVQPQDPIVDTFQKFGSVIRDSIKSGHETIQHISDAAHSARKVFTTARFAAPRVLLPYARAPTLQKDKKLMMISPRFLDITDDDQIKHEPNYVKMGDLMDAFGVSNPENEKVGLMRIIIQKNKPLVAEAAFPILQSRFGGDEENDEIVEKVNKFYVISEDIEEDDLESALQGIKDAIGVESVKDFLQEMKNDFNAMRENIKNKEIVSQPSKVKDDDIEDAELDEFLRDMFKQQQHEDQKEKVGIGLNLPENLLKPFMAQPTNDDLAQFFRDNGDDDEERKYVPNLSSRSFVSAINPELYKEKFNETLEIDSEANVKNPEKFFIKDSNSSAIVGSSNPLDEDERRTSMKFHDKLLKPFLGKVDVSEEYGTPFDGYYQRPYNDDDDGYEDDK